MFRTASNKPIFAESFQKVLEIVGHRRKALTNLGFIKSTAVTYSKTVALYTLRIFNLVVNNLDRVVFKFSAAYAEMFAQLTTTLSVFLLGAPFGYPGVAASGYSSHIVGEVFSESLENLAAIQHQLYVISPMLMIVSVTGLLVALIGAPLFVSPGHATKKVAHKH